MKRILFCVTLTLVLSGAVYALTIEQRALKAFKKRPALGIYTALSITALRDSIAPGKTTKAASVAFMDSLTPAWRKLETEGMLYHGNNIIYLTGVGKDSANTIN